MKKTFTFACLGAAALAVSGCSIPTYDTASPEPVQLRAPAPVVAPVAVTKPAAPAAPVQQAAAEVAPEEVKPKNPWAHIPIGNTTEPDGGDEDSGWSG